MKLLLSTLFVALSIVGFSQDNEGLRSDQSMQSEPIQLEEMAVSTSDEETPSVQKRDEVTEMTISKKREKIKMRDVVKKVRSIKKQKKSNSGNSSVPMVLLIILAILLPWLAVGLHTGWDTMLTLVSFLLWLLFVVPGIVFALLVIFDVIG